MSSDYTISQVLLKLELNTKQAQTIRSIAKSLNVGIKKANGYRVFSDNDILTLKKFLNFQSKNRNKLNQKEILEKFLAGAGEEIPFKDNSFLNMINKTEVPKDKNISQSDIESLKDVISSNLSEKISSELNRIFDVSKMAIVRAEELGQCKAMLEITKERLSNKENDIKVLNSRIESLKSDLLTAEQLLDLYKTKINTLNIQIERLNKKLNDEKTKNPLAKLFNL